MKGDDMEGGHLTNLFGSPVFVHKWKDSTALNSELKSAILAIEAKSPGVSKSNAGGWHSQPGKLEFCGAAGATLLERMIAAGNEATARVLKQYGHQPRTFEWTLDAWANVNRKGHFNRAHAHAGSTWSGTYYVDLGIGESSTAAPAPLHIYDPCQARANTFLSPFAYSTFILRPEPGLMILFPSYLQHMVLPQETDEARISIAFNLRREPFP